MRCGTWWSRPGRLQHPQRPQRPGQDPVHPEPGTPSRGRRPEEMERRRDEHDDLREDF
ncbi:hypothetical protein [Streptomyces virginiae]|uniref:hypothetical protein n=1 Tax=Streptomyces virginiae TaxID=1961 RepID=UPI0036854994